MAFAAEVGGGGGSRCKQQVGDGVDLAAELFGPRRARIKAAQASLDMRQREAAFLGRARAAERARRVALDDD